MSQIFGQNVDPYKQAQQTYSFLKKKFFYHI